ncbi:MAG: hypothetical protein HKO53_00015 [Gemmatimonadetes bacterium]|nr:hypothetical protein [Gemmatimonadota bacterium]
MRTLRLSAMLTTLMLALVACSSDEPGAMDPEDTPGNLAPGTARITISGTTWMATATICGNFGGTALRFAGVANTDPNVSFDLDAVPADPPSNSARVDVSQDVSWRAGESVVPDGGTVPVVTAQNGYGTGSATFVNTLDPDGISTGVYETASGDYEFNCQ